MQCPTDAKCFWVGFPQKFKMSSEFIVMLWGTSVHSLEIADLGGLPVFL